MPLDWAMTQNSLGTALWTLGERESGTARLAEAVAVRLGERKSGTALLEEGVAAFDACLTVAKTSWPAEWVQQMRSHRDQMQAEIIGDGLRNKAFQKINNFGKPDSREIILGTGLTGSFPEWGWPASPVCHSKRALPCRRTWSSASCRR